MLPSETAARKPADGPRVAAWDGAAPAGVTGLPRHCLRPAASAAKLIPAARPAAGDSDRICGRDPKSAALTWEW